MHKRSFAFTTFLGLINLVMTASGYQNIYLAWIIGIVAAGFLIYSLWPWIGKTLNKSSYWLARMLLQEDVSNLLNVNIQPHWGRVGNKRSLDFWIDVFNGSLGKIQLEEKVAGIMGFSTSSLKPAPLPTAPIVELPEGRAERGKIARLRIRQPLEHNEAESIEQFLSDGQAVTFYFSDVTVSFWTGRKHHRLPLPGTISFRQSLRVIGQGSSSYSPLKAARSN